MSKYSWILQNLSSKPSCSNFVCTKTKPDGHADVDLKVQKCPCVKHGNVLGKYSHAINMGLKLALC